ncbi:MAG: tryptophan synthase subunit alpha [Epsilonproteobacteria bacterium]|nr:MAG: tryptophan synthase subunit alpha [Campylobacterota bacterium]
MKKLVGFVTASLPNLNFTIDLVSSMAEAGLDIVEIGAPFSDPVADGKIIEKASQEAIKAGFKFDDIFKICKQVSNKIDTYTMGYANMFYRYGIENYIKKANSVNIKGTLIPDMPFEEAIVYQDIQKRYGHKFIDFVAPTDDKRRIKHILQYSSNFIYLVAYAGITGQNKQTDLSQTIANIRQTTDTPVYLGFGVDENNAKEKSQNVDGVIVGSAFMRDILDESLNFKEKLDIICSKTKKIKEQIC